MVYALRIIEPAEYIRPIAHWAGVAVVAMIPIKTALVYPLRRVLVLMPG